MRVVRPVLAAGVLTAALASAAQATVVRSASGPLAATLTAGTHSPKAGAQWPVKVIATLAGRPARAAIVYQFVFGGQVVSSQIPRYTNGRPHTSFTGTFSDSLQFPARAVGFPLTLRMHITAGGRIVNLDYALQVAR